MLDGLSPPLRNHTDTVTHQRRNSYDVISFQELLYKNELCNTVTTEMKSEITVGQTDLLPISRRALFKVPSVKLSVELLYHSFDVFMRSKRFM